MKRITCLVFLLPIFLSCSPGPFVKPVVNNGFIDVSNWDFEKNGNIELKGTWHFKWMDFKESFLNEEIDTSRWDTIKVPSFWNHKEDTGREGFASLRLVIKTGKNHQLGMYLKSCLSAYDFYLNKEKAMSAGRFGFNKKKTTPQIKPNFIKIQTSLDTITVLWRISNFHTYNGGPESIPVLGDYQVLKKQLWVEEFQRAVILGIIIMLIIFNILLWVGRKKDNYTFFFAFFCLLILIRSFVFNDFLVKIFPAPSTVIFELQYKIDFLAETLGFYAFSHYFRSLFPEETNKTVLTITDIIFLSLSFLILILNAKQNVAFSVIYNTVTPLSALWLVYILLIAIKRKKSGAFTLLCGFLILLITVINDILYSQRIIYTFFLSDIGTILCLLSQTIVISKVFSFNFKQAEYLSQNLQKEVCVRTRELEKARKQIEQQSEQKSLFFINFAHETKTPLTIIKNNLNEYLKKATLTNELKAIKTNTNKLCRNIINLLDSKKIEQGSLLYNNDTIIDASNALFSILDQFKANAKKKRIQLTCSGEDSLLLNIDPYAFERVINNVLDNAIKYTGKNGHIDATIRSRAGSIIITVKDNGIGISKMHLKKIFLPYYQVSKEKRNIQGLGLGLYIIKNILKHFRGRIQIDSVVDEGTIVKIIFPEHVAPGSKMAVDFLPREEVDEINPGDLPEEPYDDNKPTVFILEDNIELISFMQKSMCDVFNVLYATNGKQGFEKLDKIPKPDIIISDIMMDTMDGHEFYYKLTTIERLKDIPFIFLTARTSREEKLESLKKGVIDYIYKPFDKDELIEKIKSILKNRQAHTESEIKKMEKRLSALLRMNGDDEFLNFEKKCKIYKLSPREKEVLRGLLEGLQIKEIAGKLYVSVHTIRNHIRHIYNKCNVQNRVELVNIFK